MSYDPQEWREFLPGYDVNRKGQIRSWWLKGAYKPRKRSEVPSLLKPTHRLTRVSVYRESGEKFVVSGITVAKLTFFYSHKELDDILKLSGCTLSDKMLKQLVFQARQSLSEVSTTYDRLFRIREDGI